MGHSRQKSLGIFFSLRERVNSAEILFDRASYCETHNVCIVQTALLQSSENKEGLEKMPTITAALDTSWYFTVLVALPLQAPCSQSHSENVSTQMLLSFGQYSAASPERKVPALPKYLSTALP